jgi:hypothetical protein
MSEVKGLEVGDVIRYCDQVRCWHNALVTAVHGEPQRYRLLNEEEERLHYPCVNLLWVVRDEGQQDQYGRQIGRETSVSHFEGNVASGFFWCHPEDEERASKKMAEALHHIKS